ncbi:hypothetical protein C1645_776377 [Glomus cerebriforme]|uniref:Uncharacterized protein n=1 Tax=Glomus cerebriforme TaxID=658196 RepID=A0A397SYL6_9GLOM|nr:hypothetical protein C1645_776377 [Glomus cerebriforme]
MTSQCCYCIPLKAGVVFISLLWLIYGIYGIISNVMYFASPEYVELVRKNFEIFNGYIITAIILYGLVIIGSAFGLFVITFANTTRMLLIYSKIAYGILTIEIISRIISFVIIILYASPVLLTYVIVGGVFTIAISIHFSMVISSYAHRRGKKESPIELSHSKINDNL